VLLLVHGTGLNGLAWAPVAEALLNGSGAQALEQESPRQLAFDLLRPVAVDLRGHGSSERSAEGDYDWQRCAEDVLAVTDNFGWEQRSLVGAGHSAGATSLLLAEAQRPGTFGALWLWEPVIDIPGSGLAKLTAPALAARARRRKRHFLSVEDARSHLAGRGIFAEFSQAAFDAFMEGALVRSPAGGWALACDPSDEALMYEASALSGAWERLALVGCPVRVLGGELSAAVPPGDVSAIAEALPAGEAVAVAGLGHFGPFQAPNVVADDIGAWALAVP